MEKNRYIKEIFQYFRVKKEPPELKKEINEKVFHSNLRNLQYLNVIVFITALLNLLNDIFSLSIHSEKTRSIYFGADLLLLLLVLVYAVLFVLNYYEKLRLDGSSITVFLALVFIWAAVISSVHANVTQENTTYVVTLMIGMMLFYHKKPVTLFLLALAVSTRFLAYKLIHGSLDSLEGQWITHFIFILIFYLVSHVVYTNKQRGLIFEIRMNTALASEARANQAKTRFLRNISHELRTPLTGILGFSDAVEQLAKDKELRSYGQLISGEGKKLLSLINRLLDISKIESDKLELCNEPFPLRKMLQDFILSYGERARLKGIEFRSHIEDSIPEGARGDEERIIQILANLTGNALKFTEKGYISLEVQYLEEEEKTFLLRFSIKDTGIGIDPAKLESIFKPFEQADSSISRSFGGTGLGTTLSKELIELMGGGILVTSTPGAGSEFTFFIRLQHVPDWNLTQRGSGKDKDQPLKAVKVLVVDDYNINRQIANMYLTKAGAKVSEAKDGKECLARLVQERFDLILLDVNMPVMDGLETIDRIRRDDKLKNTLVLGLTADAYEEDRRKFISLGMNEVIAKPFNRKTLVKKITEQLGKELKPPIM